MKKIISAEATKVKRGLLCAVSIAALGAIGCASDADGLNVDANDDAPEAQALQAPSSSGSIKDPKDAYIGEVTANGSGCPAGTWTTSLSDDGQTFTTTFNSFEVEVDRQKAVHIKNCQLAIKLHSPQGISFTVEDYYYGGYVYLEDGVQLRQQSNYYFQGYPNEGETITSDTTGPTDKSYLIQDTRADVNLVKSRCGTDHQLNVNATLRLLNSSQPRKNGYANVSAVDGNIKLVWKLSWKRCNA